MVAAAADHERCHTVYGLAKCFEIVDLRGYVDLRVAVNQLDDSSLYSLDPRQGFLERDRAYVVSDPK